MRFIKLISILFISSFFIACGSDDESNCTEVPVDAGTDTLIDSDDCIPAIEICDGIDNNCDGVVDEMIQNSPLHCGACDNVCEVENAVAACVDQLCVVGNCEPGFQNLDGMSDNGCETICEQTQDGIELCDGIDNDCNGMTDDGFNLSTDNENCGVCGRTCAADGVEDGECINGRCVIYACQDGFLNNNGITSDGCEYACSISNHGVETCDGIDNDCDGSTDVRTQDPPVLCFEEGVCRGVQSICRGTAGWECPYPELYQPGSEAVCDGRDNNCDGSIDEAFGTLGDPCDGDDDDLCEDGVLICSPDGSGTICNEVRNNVEICDNEDNDCDGEIDEDFDFINDIENCGGCRIACNAFGANGSCNDGICSVDGCAEGYWDINNDGADGCEYVCTINGPEICDGIDNDCNGIPDDNPTDSGSSCLDQGVCASIRPVCGGDDGWICAYPSVYESEESLCDGLDNDCDGDIDETFPTIGDFCDGDDDDLCSGGVFTCSDDATSLQCTDSDDSIVELCDGVDNDCDGDIDEDWNLTSDPNNCGRCGQTCSLENANVVCSDSLCEIDSCHAGFVDSNEIAVDGCELACVVTGSETCDGIDNDCNGLVDDGLVGPPPSTLPGVCFGVPARCNGEQGWEFEFPNVFQEIETLCDYLDNDCDGNTDESDNNANLVGLGEGCSDGIGACLNRGIIACTDDGTEAVCSASAGSPLAHELCNNIDDDCDGETDEEIPRLVEMVQLSIGDPAYTYWIDRYEASRPDATADSRGFNGDYACSRQGVLPWENLTWQQAQDACEARGKRLCTDEEWFVGCHGDDDSVYPYGDEYDSETCNTGSGNIAATEELFECSTPTDLYDLSGNLAEWASCERDVDCQIVRPVLGGSFADEIDILFECGFRNNLAPSTYSGEIGFRCCADE